MLEQRFVESFFDISVLTLQKLYDFEEMIAAITSDIF